MEPLQPSAGISANDLLTIVGATIRAITALLVVLMSLSEWSRTRRETFRFLGWAFSLIVIQQVAHASSQSWAFEGARDVPRLYFPIALHLLEACFLVLLSHGMAVHERGSRGVLRRITHRLIGWNVLLAVGIQALWYLQARQNPDLTFDRFWGEWFYAILHLSLLGLGVYLAWVLRPGIRVGPALGLLAIGKAAHLTNLILLDHAATALHLTEWASASVAAIMLLAAAHFGIVTETFTDPLTRLHNRRYFMTRVGEEFDRARRRDAAISVLIADLDRFKRFNDTQGHVAGDKLLRSVAVVLSRNLRPYDVLCRWGGEEFIALLPDTEPAVAVRVAERLREQVADLCGGAERPAPVTISVGVASFPDSADHWRDVVEAADAALYQAKQRRNRVCLYSPP